MNYSLTICSAVIQLNRMFYNQIFLIEQVTKSASSATHLSLAVMIENLFKLGAVITSGTLGRLDRAMEESRQQGKAHI